MKKLVLILAVLALAVGALSTQKDRILTGLMARGMEAGMGADLIAELDDGLHVALCGAGGPLPAPKASGPCVAVVAGGRLFVIDAGTDGVRNMTRMGLPPGQIEAVFLTHYHSDHLDGLGELATLRWVGAANTSPLPVYGPPGVEQVVTGFNMAYQMDSLYRHEHHGDTVAPISGTGMEARTITEPAADAIDTVINDGDLLVEVISVGHAPVAPAVGYRFTYKGRSTLITGDTIAMESVLKFAQGIDLLVHEALAPNLVKQMNSVAQKLNNAIISKITMDILDYHASPMDAALIAKEAQVGHLLYYHIVPPMVVPGQASLFLDGADKVFSDYTIGEDGVMFSMPAGSTEIIKARSGL